ncbi:MAG: RRXRR domain-containing protein [Chloracidobacterium sp.]|nr:RRXRR domain-containing protein [Chloracidobacterium sp.]
MQRRHKTYSGALPQLRTLEVAAADTVRVTTKRIATEAQKPHLRCNIPEGETTGKGRRVSGPVRAFFGETKMAVFVLGKKKQPLMPRSEKRARLLLERGRAVVAPVHPFTIRLKDRVSGDTHPVAVKIDPGSRTTGIAVVRENESTDTETGELWREATVLALMELEHRGGLISKKLTARAAFRRRRRSANLRHRAPRFDNRSRPKGSPGPEPTAPGRYDDVLGGGDSRALAPVTRVAMELAPFDPQKMENPGISGFEYSKGLCRDTRRRVCVRELGSGSAPTATAPPAR